MLLSGMIVHPFSVLSLSSSAQKEDWTLVSEANFPFLFCLQGSLKEEISLLMTGRELSFFLESYRRYDDFISDGDAS